MGIKGHAFFTGTAFACYCFSISRNRFTIQKVYFSGKSPERDSPWFIYLFHYGESVTPDSLEKRLFIYFGWWRHQPIRKSSILDYIRQAKDCTQQKAYNHSGSYRMLQCDEIIGYDQYGNNTNSLTVFTDAKGNILTAFPGKFEPKEKPIETIEATCTIEPIGFA